MRIIIERIKRLFRFDEFLVTEQDATTVAPDSPSGKPKIKLLAGVALLCENRVLLVLARKYRHMDNKWSFPKGKLEGQTSSIDTASKELYEETGISILPDELKNSRYVEIVYTQGNVQKYLDLFIHNVPKSKIIDHIDSDWRLVNYTSPDGEIVDAKFVLVSDIKKYLDKGMREAVDFL